MFLAAIGVIMLGSAGYLLAHRRAARHLEAASKWQDRLFGYFRTLTDGAKEPRQNLPKWAIAAELPLLPEKASGNIHQ